MSEPVVLWRRDADPALPSLPPLFTTGYHLPTDVEYRALPAAEWDAALAEAYARGKEEAAKVCLDMAEEITREEIPYHKREERSGAIVREMQSRRCAAAIRAGGA